MAIFKPWVLLAAASAVKGLQSSSTPTATTAQQPGSSATAPLNSKAVYPFTAGFDRHAEDILEQWKVPGMSFAVIDGNQVFSKAYPSKQPWRRLGDVFNENIWVYSV
ncbi:hypothetical protein HIM_11267 [Hirsutella minnesotensis 3608]|uniref:Uncharacterized protein n=1 Tax=Hirsutella minnesotensis 3608 TaxID=1043627 RepID=A0A0F7ZJ66_9HYPO|nr:hypothetical protein HIM_11267 [Hirsutella minnesotensis 3608]